jgi:hypothetical protein
MEDAVKRLLECFPYLDGEQIRLAVLEAEAVMKESIELETLIQFTAQRLVATAPRAAHHLALPKVAMSFGVSHERTVIA